MSKNGSSSSSSGGIGFVGLLTIAFIVLKLTGVIAWSWWWVLSPIWIATIVALILIFGFLAIAGWASSK
jgi:hypothetical protein